MPNTEPLGYIIELDDLTKLRTISQALNDPTITMDWDKRRDLANLLDYLLSPSRLIPVT